MTRLLVEFKDDALGGPVFSQKMLTVPRVNEYVTGNLVGGQIDQLYRVIMVIHTSLTSAFVLLRYTKEDFHTISGKTTW